MKCSKCGFKARSLPSMARHYRKKHPAAMKRHPLRKLQSAMPKSMKYLKSVEPRRFCPHCGGFLG